MDTQAFVDALAGVFEGEPAEGVPADPRFAEIAADVTGFSTPAELAVLQLAARLLPEGECYLEVGTFKGRSICGAMLDAPDRRFVAVENFQEFGMLAAESRAELDGAIRRHVRSGRLRLVDGDGFRVLRDGSAVSEPVGVYFYDGAHTDLAHYLALGVAEPLLADEALVLVDDASWPMVEQATLRYIERHPGWEVLEFFRAASDHDPLWANGLMVLRYRRPPGVRPARTSDVEWRLALQRWVRGPADSFAWRTLHRFPGLVPLAKRIVPSGSRTVPGS
ncbi:MAG TPA: class I SAM-dependent methyltransferase [Mycobacteriales bacterium]|jgi:predicted O-methyltransferase YrrM|nr:class SAM-dependent methyltransferase [Cryptosporangiaceae bacterium]HEV7754328.1 class I SAM-dependent methyltransferase [Mycobacteriales bacterium]